MFRNYINYLLKVQQSINLVIKFRIVNILQFPISISFIIRSFKITWIFYKSLEHFPEFSNKH